MLKYLLFDLDGTLTDSGEGIRNAVKYAVKDILHYEETDIKKLNKFIGPPLNVGFSEQYGMNEEDILRGITKFREYYNDKGIYENTPYEGISDTLDDLKKSGYVLAVASSKPQVMVYRVLERFDLKRYFDVIVGCELDGRRSDKKEVVEEVIRQLENLENDISKDGDDLREPIRSDITKSAAMIGDRCYDMEGAIEHKLMPIGVSYGYGSYEELMESGASIITSSAAELEKILLDMAQHSKCVNFE